MEFCKMATTQKICVYLDYATIPSLNYILHFAQHFEDQETIRLFGLSRFTIPERIIHRYPPGVVQFYPNKDKDFSLLLSALEKILSEKQEQQEICEIELHLNLFHYQKILFPFLALYRQYKENIVLKLKCYDDGSEAISVLQEISQNSNLIANIRNEQENIAHLFEPSTFTPSLLSRFFLGTLFDCEYILFNQSILEQAKLSPLRKIMANYRQIDFNIYQKLNKVQQQLVLDIFNINLEKIELLIPLIKRYPSFLFLGTTLFDADESTKNWLTKFHIDLIFHHCAPKGKFFNNKQNYLFFYKGHPNERKMNEKILNQLKNLILLPDDVPLEILLLLGVVPTKVGGFASSALFNFNKEQIENVVFFTPRYLDESNKLYSTQYHLLQGLTELGYIYPENISTYLEMMNILTKE